MRKTRKPRIRGLNYLRDAVQYDPNTREFWVEKTLEHNYKISARAYSKDRVDQMIGSQFKRYCRFLKYTQSTKKKEEQTNDNRLQSRGRKGNRKIITNQKNGRKRSR